MKQCPYCKANIEDNARFCLYCMKSLEEKKEIKTLKTKSKRWPIIIAAVLVFIIGMIAVFCLLPKSKPQSKNESNNPLSDSSQLQDQEAEALPDLSPEDNPSSEVQNEPSSSPNPTNPSTPGNTTPSNVGKDTTSTPEQPDTPTPGNTPSSNGGNDTTSTPEQPDTSTPEPDKPNTPTEEETPTTPAVSYIYRDAKYGDDLYVGAYLDDAVVITGVENASATGEYVIPSTINGKRVVAIMGNAFSDVAIKDTVKQVVVPASVKNIWNYAFSGCYNMTDIYFCGTSIYVDASAFATSSNRTGTLTIHCSYDCSNRDFRYYRNIASWYNALYKEWNN